MRDALAIPIAALPGDNVVDPSERMPWWDGGTFLERLETIEIAADRDAAHRRFPVQWVVRPMSDEHHDYRGYAGQVAGGEWRAGDEVVVLPSGLRTTVAAVETHDGPLDVAVQGQSVVVRLDGRARRLTRRHAVRPRRTRRSRRASSRRPSAG